MRSILGLFEGVVTGAADGYARMAGRPACTLLHLGPGLANGLANLHNARKARSPIVNVVGEHATYHLRLDAPLTSDIEGFARPVSAWVRTSETSESVGRDGAEAVQAARQPPGRIATLILPADVAWSEPATPAAPLQPPGLLPVDPSALARVAEALRSGQECAFLVSGTGASEPAQLLLSRIAVHCGARIMADTLVSRIPGGAGRPVVPRLPYFAEHAEEALAGVRHLILVDTKAPVSFFAYPGRASELTPDGATAIELSKPGEDTLGALEALVEAVGATGRSPTVSELSRPELPRGELTPTSISQALAALLPDGAILVNEGVTSGFAMLAALATVAPHDMLDVMGGAIGFGLPTATGAAVACPDRRVVALQADGSAMYTLQALWTMAREQLDVTVILFANRKYAILEVEFARVGAHDPGPRAMDMLELSRPDLEWVSLAGGMGVPAVQVREAEAFNDALARSFATPGPSLIEAVI